MLSDVDWKALSDQLNLRDQVADIDTQCKTKSCCLREMVSRYIQSQSVESCHDTKKKIAKALDDLGYVKEASLLRERELLMCLVTCQCFRTLCSILDTGPIKISFCVSLKGCISRTSIL